MIVRVNLRYAPIEFYNLFLILAFNGIIEVIEYER